MKPGAMLAATRSEYGPPRVLSLKEVEIPALKDDELMIRVCAATVNRTDCAILWGKPFIMRFFTGLFKPRSPITGTDFAGVVEAVGASVKDFKIGDRVFGFDDMGLSSHAQYMTLSAKKAAIIPESLSYEEAAACLEGVHYAYNFVCKVTLVPEERVLVNGASGAIGSALVQILSAAGVDVTAVCSTKNLALAESLGADRVIDYTQEDFTQIPEKYHFIFDAVGKSTFAKCKPLLVDKGMYISSELGPRAENLFLALITPLTGGKAVLFPYPSDIPASIRFITGLVEKGAFKAVIDRQYPLSAIAEAYDYAATGQKTGNIIIQMGHDS